MRHGPAALKCAGRVKCHSALFPVKELVLLDHGGIIKHSRPGRVRLRNGSRRVPDSGPKLDERATAGREPIHGSVSELLEYGVAESGSAWY